MEKRIAYHIYVYGTVQGVGFRYWTVSLARFFSIFGWVRNTENYRCVEILAESTSETALKEFITALKTEHPYAKVDATEVSKTSATNCKNFKVIR